jgi:hypothetical protein
LNKRYCITLLTLLFIAIRAASGDSIIIGAPCSSLQPRTATPADTIEISAGTIGSALCSQSCTHRIVPDTSEPPTDPTIPRYLVLVEAVKRSTICLQVFGVCNAFSFSLTGLAPGFYSLKVRDSLNCRRSPDGCTYETPFDTANFTWCRQRV